MAQSARFAWWLLIILFSIIILGNNLTFLILFTRRESPPLAEQSARYTLDFQMRYALFVAGSPMLRGGLKPAVEETINSLRKELYGTKAEWEARLYVALLEQLAGVGDPAATLKGLSDAPSMELEARQRRWYAPLWKKALLGSLGEDDVVRLRKVLVSSAPPLALQVAESLMWKRAGDTTRAQHLLDQLGFSSRLRLSVLVAVACCGLLWAIAGVGLLLWYLAQSFPLGERPLPTASPFALDAMLWAPVLFLLILLNGEALLVGLKGNEASPSEPAFMVIHMVAAFVPLLYLLVWSREGNNPSGVLRIRGAWWRQIAAALMGFGIYLPIMLLSLLLAIWLAPALPGEQTHPIAERPLSEMSAWAFFWIVLQAVVLAPIVEEVLFRGVLFQVLWQRTGRVWLSAFVSGFLFGVIHPQFLGGILTVTLLGVILAMVYAHTRSLLPCIVIHALNNGTAMLMLWGVGS